MEDVNIEEQDIALVVRAIKTEKAGATDGIIGELIEYGGKALRHGDRSKLGCSGKYQR